MAYCPNCKAHLTCGCQKRTSNKGVACCANCVASLNATTTLQPKNTQPTPGTAPTNVTAGYSGPGKQI